MTERKILIAPSILSADFAQKKCFENIQTNFVFGQARLKSDLDFVILMYIILKNKK